MLEQINKMWTRIQLDEFNSLPDYEPGDIATLIYWTILLGGLLAICIWLISNKKSSGFFKFFSNTKAIA